MGRKANYAIVDETPGALTVRDIGPWDCFFTVTNAAEDVVRELTDEGKLKEGQRLLYYDSEGFLSELLHERGEFRGFGLA